MSMSTAEKYARRARNSDSLEDVAYNMACAIDELVQAIRDLEASKTVRIKGALIANRFPLGWGFICATRSDKRGSRESRDVGPNAGLRLSQCTFTRVRPFTPGNPLDVCRVL